MTLRPDHRLVYRQDWADTKARMNGVKKLMQNLSAWRRDASGAACRLAASEVTELVAGVGQEPQPPFGVHADRAAWCG